MQGNWFFGLPYNPVACILCIACLCIARLIWLNARHREWAFTDRLTGAVSRLRGDIILANLEHRRRSRSRRRLWGWWNFTVAVTMLDVDHFKKVNDTYGHAAGDFVLKEIARILKGCLRSNDTLVRPGGEEFLAIFPGLGLDEAMVVGERLRAALDTTVDYEGQSIKISASLGVAALREDMTLEDIVQAADRAAYRAKKGGRNRVEPQSEKAPPKIEQNQPPQPEGE
jgi:diguanylate cyclase (GGDEF)-like protein